MAGIVKTHFTPGNTEEWLAIRNSLDLKVGGSELGAICGHSKYASFLSKLEERVGLKKEADISEKIAVVLGHYNEPLCAEMFEKVSGKTVHRENCVITNDAFPHLKASIDRKVANEDSGLECKTSFGHAMEQFDEGEFPQAYLDQCILYLAVTDLRRWYLAILTGYEFKVFLMTREQEEECRWKSLRERFLYDSVAVRIGRWYSDAVSGKFGFLKDWLRVNAMEEAKRGLVKDCDEVGAIVSFVETLENIEVKRADANQLLSRLCALYGYGDDLEDWVRNWSYLEAVYYLDDDEINGAEIKAARFIGCIEQVRGFMEGREFKSELDRLTMLRSAVEQVVEPADIDGSEATAEAIDLMKPIAEADSHVTLDASVGSNKELLDLIKQRQEESKRKKEADAEIDRLTNLIAARLKDVESTTIGRYKVTYKFSSRDTASVERVENYFKLKGEEIPEGLIKRGERKRAVRIYESKK